MRDEDLAWVRTQASERAEAVSAVLTELVQEARAAEEARERKIAAFDSLLKELLDEPLTNEELAAGRAELREAGLL